MAVQQIALPTVENKMDSLVDELRAAGERTTLEVEGHRIALTNLNKPLWPAVGETPALTKRDLLIYLTEVAPYMLPHLRDRPLTTIRMPNGIDGTKFFQKHAEKRPDFLETVRLMARVAGEEHTYFLCNNLASLLWLGQMASLEFHSSYARITPEPDALAIAVESPGDAADKLFDYPDFLVFDLDPYIYAGNEAKGEEPALNRPAFEKTCEVALWLKGLLDGLKLPSFVKTTGKTGFHIFIPINRTVDYHMVRSIAETIALHLVKLHPRDVTIEWSVAKRPGKVLIDINQNMRAKTVAAIFSPRSVPEAAVSMPLRWDELGKVYPTDFTLPSATMRIATVGDSWSGILDAKTDLLAALG